MFFKSQVACLHKLTHVYAGQYFAYFLGMLSKSYEGNEGNLEGRFKSVRLHTSRPIAELISIYITLYSIF